MSKVFEDLECFMYWLGDNVLFKGDVYYDINVVGATNTTTYNRIKNLNLEIDDLCSTLYSDNLETFVSFLNGTLSNVKQMGNSYMISLTSGQTIWVELV